MMPLDHPLEQRVVIRAPRALVFRYFTESERWARWWGEGSTIEARPGGALTIVYPGGARASGEVLELEPDVRIVFTFGYEGEGKPIAPGGSRVTVTLTDLVGATELLLRHDLADAGTRDQHVPGWRYQLALVANAVTEEAHADAAGTVDRWFAAWNEDGPEQRAAALTAVADPQITFQDRFACVHGLRDLEAHVTAARAHAPARIERSGEPRHCQGVVLADWKARAPDGEPAGEGTNLFEFGSSGLLTRVVGFW